MALDINMIGLSSNILTVLEKRYLKKDENGQVTQSGR